MQVGTLSKNTYLCVHRIQHLNINIMRVQRHSMQSNGLAMTKSLVKVVMVLSFVFMTISTQAGAPDCDGVSDRQLKALSDSLDYELNNKDKYIKAHEQTIDLLKMTLREGTQDIREEYDINRRLYDKYKKFQVDSALSYSVRNVAIGHELGDMDKVHMANLQIVYLYSLNNRFLEGKAILDSIQLSELNRDLLLEYYSTGYWFYSSYAVASGDNSYYLEANRSRDEAMRYLDPASFEYRFNLSFKYIYTPDLSKAKPYLDNLLETCSPGSPEEAFVCGIYAIYYAKLGQEKECKYMYLRSAIADIRSATRENESIQILAVKEYEHNNLDLAFKYAQAAIEDAAAGGINMHAIRRYKLNTLLSAAYHDEQQRSHTLMQRNLVTACLMLIVLVGLLAYVLRQKRKISDIRKLLEETNCELVHYNERLNANNEELSESNKVKEFYISEFFELCLNYISEIERLEISVKKLTKTRNYNELAKLMSSMSVSREYNAMYQHFDTVFLALYPTFISEVNKLLRPEEWFPETKTLNRELRVYALMRLGFRDADQIAKFLCCAVTTIYCYRSRMRNKAIDRDTFEDNVMGISSGRGASESA